MRAFLTVLAVALMMSVGVPTSAQADGFKRITTEADFLKRVAGKTYCNDTGCFKANRNGKMTGKFGGERLRAVWKWSKGFSCRAGKLGKRDLGTDCQVVEINGNQVRITRRQGRGQRVVYTRK